MSTPEHTTTAPAPPAPAPAPADGTGEILAALEEAYARTKRVSRELRTADRIGADLGIDSLATVEILLTLEERFGVALVDDPRAAKLVTVGDLVGLLFELRREVAS